MKNLIKYVAIVGAVLAFASGVQAEEISRQDITQSGTDATLTAVDAGSDTALNDEQTFIMFENTNGTAADITITAQRTSTQVQGYGTLDISDITFSVANGDSFVIAPTLGYNKDNGRIEMSYAGDTSALSVGVFKRPSD